MLDEVMGDLGTTNLICLMKHNKQTPIVMIHATNDPSCNAANCGQLFKNVYFGSQTACGKYGNLFEQINDDMLHLYVGEWSHEQITDLLNIVHGTGTESDKMRVAIYFWMFQEPGMLTIRVSMDG